MAEVLVEFETPVSAEDGTVYRARACGTESGDGTSRWEGWIEFVPVNGSKAIRTGRETTQPNRTGALYWASGLTSVYLEGALVRALKPFLPQPPAMKAAPAFEGPAPGSAPVPPIVLNPLSVYEKGESLLRGQLGALAPRHLVNIIQAFGFSRETPAALLTTPAEVLVELIVTAVRQQKVRA
jgi:hypothetical protein